LEQFYFCHIPSYFTLFLWSHSWKFYIPLDNLELCYFVQNITEIGNYTRQDLLQIYKTTLDRIYFRCTKLHSTASTSDVQNYTRQDLLQMYKTTLDSIYFRCTKSTDIKDQSIFYYKYSRSLGSVFWRLRCFFTPFKIRVATTRWSGPVSMATWKLVIGTTRQTDVYIHWCNCWCRK
jgi:hypothetical protein